MIKIHEKIIHRLSDIQTLATGEVSSDRTKLVVKSYSPINIVQTYQILNQIKKNFGYGAAKGKMLLDSIISK